MEESNDIGETTMVNKNGMKKLYSLKQLEDSNVLLNKKPPVWVNRVLDICIYYADYLREAVNRGYISGEANLTGGNAVTHGALEEVYSVANGISGLTLFFAEL